MEAAYTSLNSPLPSFINAKSEGESVVVRVRSAGANDVSQIEMSHEEWEQWLANAQRVLPQPQPSFADEQIATDPILQYFNFGHLPERLQAVSAIFYDAACKIVALVPRNAERTVALRKLLEAKDAAVRANL